MKRDLVVMILGLCIASAGCSSGDDTVAEPKAGSETETVLQAPAAEPLITAEMVTADMSSVDAVPDYARPYPDAVMDAPAVMASGPDSHGEIMTFKTAADPGMVVDYYKSRAEAAGLKATVAMDQGGARAYGADNKETGASLSVIASPVEDDLTSVQLTWNGAR